MDVRFIAAAFDEELEVSGRTKQSKNQKESDKLQNSEVLVWKEEKTAKCKSMYERPQFFYLFDHLTFVSYAYTVFHKRHSRTVEHASGRRQLNACGRPDGVGSPLLTFAVRV